MTNVIHHLKQTESNIDDFKWSLSDPFKQLLLRLKEQGVEQKVITDVEKDILVLDLGTDRKVKGYFTHKYEFLDEQGMPLLYPNIKEQFTEEVKTYLIKRVGQVKNPLLIARYNDVLWSIYKCHINTNQAIEGYIQCSMIFYEKKWDWLTQKALDRALQISISIRDKEKIDKVIDVYNCLLARTREENQFRTCIELARSLMNYYKALKDAGFNFVECLIPFLMDSAVHFSNEAKFEETRETLSIIVSIYKAEKKKELEEKYTIDIAKSYEFEGDWKSEYEENYIIASELYTESMDIYLKLGKYKSKIDELKVKIQKNNEKSTSQFVKVEKRIAIPKEVLSQYFEVYKKIEDPYEFLANMSIDSNLLPDWQKSIDFAKKIQVEYPLSNLIPDKIRSGNIVIKEIKGDKEKLNYNTTVHFKVNYQTAADILFIQLIEIFNKKFQDPHEKFVEFIEQNGLINKDRVSIIALGVKRYFERDYISACHLLLFQVEGILREMLGMLNLPTFSYRNKEMRERLLSDCIDTLSNKGIEDNFVKFLTVFLVDNTGDNLRNEFAHGIAHVTKMNQVNASLLLLSYLKLSQYKLTEV